MLTMAENIYWTFLLGTELIVSFWSSLFIPQFSYSHVTNRCLRLTQTVGMNSFSQPSLGRTNFLQPLTTGFFVKSVCQDSVLLVLAPFLLPISHCSMPVVVRHLLLMCPVHCTVSSSHIYAKYTALRVVP